MAKTISCRKVFKFRMELTELEARELERTARRLGMHVGALKPADRNVEDVVERCWTPPATMIGP